MPRVGVEAALEPFKGVITAIEPANMHGGEGNDPVALIVRRGEKPVSTFIPLEPRHTFKPGYPVVVTPTRTRVGKGAIITYSLAHIPPNE